MKQFYLILFFALSFTFTANSQTSKRTSALNYLKYGELDKALNAINSAINHPKTKEDPRTWWYRGQIYQAIHTSKEKEYHNLDLDAADKSFESYKKALLYNFKDPQYHSLDILNNPTDQITFIKLLMSRDTKYVDSEIFQDIIMNRYPSLANILVNRGVNQYQNEKNYKKALASFENSLFVSSMAGKLDTPVVYYAALASEKDKNYKTAERYYKMVTKSGYGKDEKEKASMYFLYSRVFLEQGDTAKYIETLKKGIEKYPKGNSALIVELVNHYLGTNQQNKAFDYLKVAIKSDPTNPNYHYAIGSIFDNNLKQPDSAIVAYKKAIELKADYFDANYNLGALYYNQGVEITEKANDTDDNAKYKKLKAEADNKFKQAIPYLEKAHEINKKDVPTMQSLKLLYYRTGDMDKHNKIKSELEGK